MHPSTLKLAVKRICFAVLLGPNMFMCCYRLSVQLQCMAAPLNLIRQHLDIEKAGSGSHQAANTHCVQCLSGHNSLGLALVASMIRCGVLWWCLVL